jgi:hypothetical protein
MIHHETVELMWQEYCAQEVIPAVELQRMTYREVVPPHIYGLVASLHGYILAERAGEDELVTRDVHRKVRPWWIPRRVWARLADEVVHVRLRTTPKWSYPQASIKVPKLGPAVQLLVQR